MMESVEALAVWLMELPPLGIYAVLLVVSYVENLIPPIWGDTVIVLCGWLVGVGTIAFVPTVALATLGGAAGFMTMYAIGRQLDAAIAAPARLRWIPRAPLAAAERWLKRWGQGVVIANRFLAGGRSVISLLAGASRLPVAQTVLWSSISALAWCAALVAAGAWVGTEWERVLDVLGAYGRVITALVAVGVLVGSVRWLRTRRAMGGPPQETEKTPGERSDPAERR
ncbi:MAG TPA: DedA family protein [Bacteroidetes bacterium]|nr:DedA family protein [Bacteroidota bacterium]